MSASSKVDYLKCARRHIKDAHILQSKNREANAGQLFGFSVECGLKAILVSAGAAKDAAGNIQRPYREHLPRLMSQLVTSTLTLPDGRSASVIHGGLPNLSKMHDWEVDHRYYRASAVPLASLSAWELAALEMDDLLDDFVSRGLL